MKNVITHTNQGFTLIELMIGVAIIAILSAIAIPAYNGYIATGRITGCANEISAIQLAQRQFFLENNGFFPVDGAATTVGGDYRNIEIESGGYFRSTYREHGGVAGIGGAAYLAHVNCDYTIAMPDPAGAAVSYAITVTPTPTGNLVGVPEVASLNTAAD